MFFSPLDMTYVAIALEMLAKFAVTIAFSIVYGYTVEVYPTVLRTTALGTSSMIARIGSILSPYVIYLRKYALFSPFIRVSFICLLFLFVVLMTCV